MSNTSNDRTFWIELGIDYGTATICISWVIRSQGASPSSINLVHFGRGGQAMPNIVAWHDGVFYCGHELELRVDGLKTPTVPAEKVIRFAKLNFHEGYEGPRSLNMAERVNEQLREAGKTLEDLVTEILREIVRLARHYMAERSFCRCHFTTDQMLNMETRVRLTVPQMWTPHSCRRMQEAARRAGLNVVVLAFEPQAVLAAFLHQHEHEGKVLPVELKAGDVILVADLGAGTGDFVSYQLVKDLDIHSPLEAIYKSSGAICGSQIVNDRLLEEAENCEEVQKAGGIGALCNKLDMSLARFREAMFEEIESCKKRFTGNRPGTWSLYSADQRFEIHCKFREERIRGAYDAVIATIFQQLDEHMNRGKVDMVLIAGGFSHSLYLQSRIQDKFDSIEDGPLLCFSEHTKEATGSTMVAYGALTDRYGSIGGQKLPHQYHFAMLQWEYYNHRLHTDAWEPGEPYRSGGGRLITPRKIKANVVTPSEFDPNEKIVWDRLHFFFKKSDRVRGNETYFCKQEYLLLTQSPRLQATFVYTASDDFQTHGPAREEYGGRLLPGIHELATVSREFDPAELARRGFRVQRSGSGQDHYVITARVAILYRGEQEMVIGWEIELPRGGRWHIWEDQVWETNHSSFVGEPV